MEESGIEQKEKEKGKQKKKKNLSGATGDPSVPPAHLVRLELARGLVQVQINIRKAAVVDRWQHGVGYLVLRLWDQREGHKAQSAPGEGRPAADEAHGAG